jgi:hypothetical protein
MCRNNSTGMLLGCHLREHKWQKLKMIAIPLADRSTSRHHLARNTTGTRPAG